MAVYSNAELADMYSENYNNFKACRWDVKKSIRLSKLKYYEHKFSTAAGSK